MTEINHNDPCINIVDAIMQNFNAILLNAGSKKLEFDTISEILDKFVKKIAVIKDKSNKSEYNKGKKKFNRFLAYNYTFLKNNLDIDKNDIDCDIFHLFEDPPNEHWNMLHLSVVSYLSYIKHTSDDKKINYVGMIDKLMTKIEEYDNDDSDDEHENKQNDKEHFVSHEQMLLNEVKKKIPTSEKTPDVMKKLLGDIKGIFSSGEMNSKNIVDLSKDISTKYQSMIEKGDVSMNDLLGGVMGLLTNPDAIGEDFDDIDPSKLPDPNNILKEMSNDDSLKQTMNMLGGKDGINNIDNLNTMMKGMMGSLMGGSANDDPDAPKTIQGLENEIERMMLEVVEMEKEK